MSLTPPAEASLVAASPSEAMDASPLTSEEAEQSGVRIDSDDETDGTPSTAQPSTSKADNIGKSAETTIPSAAGEMERRAEEKLLDVRIREKYQKEIGDIFADDE